MNPQLEKILETQRDSWNKSSPGWKKWDNELMEFLKPVGEALIDQLPIKPDQHILDVATGTGEPGLTIASILSQGKVTATDLSSNMLAVASENAIRRRIKNFETICCDASDLPMENDTFDGISCRMGFMFFPDMALTIEELIRVLKPGGCLVASVWNSPQKNIWITAFMETVMSRMEIQPAAPGAPGLFRCSGPGLMTGLFQQAGLKNVQEKEIAWKLSRASKDAYWELISEVSAPVVFGMTGAELKNQIKEEVLAKIAQESPGGIIDLNAGAIIISGQK